MSESFQLKAVISAKSDGMVAALKQVQIVSKTTRKYLLDVARSAGNFNSKLGLPATIGLSGVAFAAARAANSAMAYASSIQDATDRTGASAEGFQALTNMLGQVGGTAEDAENAFKKFNKGIATAAAGGNKSFASLMGRMGISMRDSKGQIRGLEQVLPQLAEAFKRNENPAVRTRMVMELFGKSGVKMLPVLLGIADGTLKLADAQQAMGAIVSGKSISALDNLGDSMAMLNVQIQSQMTTSLAKLEPVLSPIIKNMSVWIEKNQEWIQLQITTAITSLVNGISKIDFVKVVEGTKKFFVALGDVVDKLGGAGNAMLGLIGIMAAPMIAATAGLISSCVRLILWLGSLAGSALTTKLTMIGLNNSILDMAKKSLPAASDGFGKMKNSINAASGGASGLLGKLEKISGVAAAGALGWEIGTAANDYLINPAVQWATGKQDETLGGWIYDKTHQTDLTGGGRVKASGSIDININGAPAGTRVEQIKSGGDVPFRANVGHRSFALGL